MRSSHNGDSSEIFGTNRFATDKLPHAASPIRTTIANLRWLPPYLYTTHPDHVQTILRARAGGGGHALIWNKCWQSDRRSAHARMACETFNRIGVCEVCRGERCFMKEIAAK